MGGVTTYYIGNYFEWTGSTSSMIKYYYAGSQRVAMRQGSSALYYLLGDHLGSTAITANSNGTLYTEQRYYPWGDTRYNSPTTTPTAYLYTGQRKDATGLYFYNARYYDPTLGRFLSADSIVPSPANPQSLNRYSYVLNNPLRYTDPTGHFSKEQIEGYLRKHHGDQWKMYWDAWESDHLFFSMLAAAQYGDVLFAPTSGMCWGEPSLLPGVFRESSDGSFTFNGGGYGLEQYQGRGPYKLLDSDGNPRGGFDLEQTFAGHLVDVDKRLRADFYWEQPVYYYGSDGPINGHKMRTVRYQAVLSSIRVSPLADSPITDPAGWALTGIGWALGKKFGEGVAHIFGRSVLMLGIALTVNDAIVIDYGLSPVIPYSYENLRNGYDAQ